MRAAEKTIEFVKQWIAGTYTKRQYQNYYIVKTPHAQFLLKQTEQRELLAIKDNTGHIYMFDNDLPVNTWNEPRISDSEAMSNPFLCLIQEDYQFTHTRVAPDSLCRQIGDREPLSNMSKWKVLDRVEVSNMGLSIPLYLSLVEIGDHRYYIAPDMKSEEVPNNGGKLMLKDWAQHTAEMRFKFPHKWLLYNVTALYSNKINTVAEIKGNYLIMAGEEVDRSWINQDGWIFIPTAFDSIEQITGTPFREAKKTRPNPYAYGLQGSNINPNQLYRRYETVDENVEALKQCLNLREDFDSSNWRETIITKFVSEAAEDAIAYFEADDAWLREHYEVAKAGHMEARLRSKISFGFGLGPSLMFINKETNPSPLGDYVVYLKTKVLSNGTFTKIVPAPTLAHKMRGLFDGDN